MKALLSRTLYDVVMEPDYSFDEAFKDAVRRAGAQARLDTLKAGVSVFYRDRARNIEVMEHPNGQVFEIRYIEGQPAERNFEVIRELNRIAV